MQETQIQEDKTVSDQATPARRSFGVVLLGGSSALGAATAIERGLGFLANIAAARWGGAHVFGAYSVAMTTANNVASYAGAGIGTTANRFSGEYPYGRPGYGALLRSLAVVSLGSASLAAVILWFTADVIAQQLLRNSALGPLLRLAAISAGTIILLECLRGLLIGQRRFLALSALCILAGGGLAAVLPIAATYGPSAMVAGQAVVASGAIIVCVLFARRLGFAAPRMAGDTAGPRPAAIVRFGLVQLAGVIGINASGWWIASLVARSDVGLIQMGWYSAAMQMRNVCMMAPMLISQTAYSQLTDEGGREYGGPGRVTVVSTLAASLISLAVSGLAAAVMPWVMPHTYGNSFTGADLAATLAVATGLIHMAAAPAAARLTVVSLRLTGVINGIWTIFTIGFGTWLVTTGGAAAATSIFLAAHFLAAVLVVVALLWLRAAPASLIVVTVPALIGSGMLGILAWVRFQTVHPIAFSGAMLLLTALLISLSIHIGRRAEILHREFSIFKLIADILAHIRAKRALPGKV